ncbi:DUF4426 domain-containing protein [Ferrimonas lipolytica]|uniref:DUF4426 domain-containing protein n=1 Tax=Ferrimonas lipolytica TaxID=2724191 RepID=A0A6H1UAV8_9GAMM|nr:DUF4426 domain-containing protein [Ferrimonas lipolytica]QIZ75720.1 DUF4426 domain-containing protein [Ferrimonas lipolytica]
MFKSLLLLIASVCLSFTAAAEQKMQVGKYAIHYVTFGSTFLTPEIAKSYGVKRSRYTGLVNISVLDTSQQGEVSAAVAANISGQARDLTGITKNLDFREIREGEAIYYIAELDYRNEETYHFDIDVSHDNDLTTKLKFKQKFYVD